jgi:CBS domain-containing protein
VQDYAGDEVVTIGADDSVDEALSTMSRAGVRRLPRQRLTVGGRPGPVGLR